MLLWILLQFREFVQLHPVCLATGFIYLFFLCIFVLLFLLFLIIYIFFSPSCATLPFCELLFICFYLFSYNISANCQRFLNFLIFFPPLSPTYSFLLPTLSLYTFNFSSHSFLSSSCNTSANNTSRSNLFHITTQICYSLSQLIIQPLFLSFHLIHN